MLEVALETSHRRASVALRTPEGVEEVALADDRSHASDALLVLERLLRAKGLDARELDAVYVGTGPGSYTGLRIGIATALGLARGAGAVLRGEPSGETLVWRELDAGEEGVLLLDARQSELYFAHYRRLEEDVEVLQAPRALTVEALRARLPANVTLLGDRSALALAGLEARGSTDLRTDVIPSAAALLELAGRRLEGSGAHGYEEVEPLYLRPFRARLRKR